MIDLFSDETRRNPYPLYAQLRSRSPLLHDPLSNLWMVFDYDGVKRVLTDHQSFSSRHGPVEWMIFLDPPRHSKVRALVAQAFTPRSVTDLEPRAGLHVLGPTRLPLWCKPRRERAEALRKPA